MPTTPKATQGPIELLTPSPRGKATKGAAQDSTFADTLAAQTIGADTEGSVEDTIAGPAKALGKHRSRGSAAAKDGEATITIADTAAASGRDTPAVSPSASPLSSPSPGGSAALAARPDGSMPMATPPNPTGAHTPVGALRQPAGTDAAQPVTSPTATSSGVDSEKVPAFAASAGSKTTAPLGPPSTTGSHDPSANGSVAGTTDPRPAASGIAATTSVPTASPTPGSPTPTSGANASATGDAGTVIDPNGTAASGRATKPAVVSTVAAAAQAPLASSPGNAQVTEVSNPATVVRSTADAGTGPTTGTSRTSRSGETGGVVTKAPTKGLTTPTAETTDTAKTTNAAGISGSLSPAGGSTGASFTLVTGPAEPGPLSAESLTGNMNAGAVETAADVHASAQAEDPLGAPIDLTADPEDLRAQLGDRVAMAVTRGVERAEVQVRPEGMGPIRIELTMQGNEAHVQFAAAHADTRNLLADSTDALRGMLAERGIQLGSATVGQDGGRAPSDQERAPQGTLGWIATRSTDSDAEPIRGALPVSSGRSGATGVDLFA